MPVYFPGNGLPAGVKPLGFRTGLAGEPVILSGNEDVTDQIGGGDGAAGPAVLRSFRNIPHDSVTVILLPTAPQELALSWYESGTSGNLRFVLEAASLADATSRLSDDLAHGELASGGAPFGVSFQPTNSPVYLYVRASSPIGAGSSILSVAAKVPA